MTHLRGFFLLGILFIAVLQLAGVLYFMDDPTPRLLVGLTLLVPIVWVSTRTHFFQVIRDLPMLRERKYVKMRVQVEQLLAEVRRLNGIAVDADRGFRSRPEAETEMDVIEQRMVELITRLRQNAGRTSEEVNARPVPAEALGGHE